MDEQLTVVMNGLQGLAERLVLEGRFGDAGVAAAGVMAIRGLRTMLQPAPAPSVEKPVGPPP